MIEPAAPAFNLAGRVQSDLSGCSRRIEGIFTPTSREEALDFITKASRDGAKLHPISGGKNWGFGSRLPVEEDVFILDLSKLKAIKLHLDQDYAEIEPGVTQGELHLALVQAGDTHYFNVTGAGHATSVLGNGLERGIGYFGSKKDDLLDLQIASSSGELFWTKNQPLNPHHPGLGSDLTGAYLQSGWGIALGCNFRLRKRPPYMAALIVRLRPGVAHQSYFEQIVLLCRENFVTSVPHIVNRQRMITTFAPYVPADQLPALKVAASDWSCLMPVSGTRGLVGVLLQLMQERLGDLADIRLIDTDSKDDPLMAPALDLALGRPNDFALASVAFAALGSSGHPTIDLDLGRAGLIHVAPCCASKSKTVTQLLNLIEEQRCAAKLPLLPLTVNVVNSGTAVVVVSIPFDRHNPADTARAKDFAKRLHHICSRQGFSPYRLGLEDVQELTAPVLHRSRVLRKMKQSLEGRSVMAASRYDSLMEKVNSAPNLPSSTRIEIPSFAEATL